MLQNGAHLVLCYKAVPIIWSNTVRLVSCAIKAAPLICLNTNIRRLLPCAIKDVPLIWTKGASCVLCYQGWATNLVPYGAPGALCYRGCATNLIQFEMPGFPVLSRLCHSLIWGAWHPCYQGFATNLIQSEMPGVPVLSRIKTVPLTLSNMGCLASCAIKNLPLICSNMRWLASYATKVVPLI